MQELDVAEIENVVGHQFVMRSAQQVTGAHRIMVTVEAIEARRRAVGGPLGRAHPHPDETVLFDDRIGSQIGVLRHGAMGIVHAAPGAIELEAMIAAANAIADERSPVQRRETMRASVGRRGEHAVRCPRHEDRIAEEPPAEERTRGDLVRPRADVPRVPQKRHRLLPVASARFSKVGLGSEDTLRPVGPAVQSRVLQGL